MNHTYVSGFLCAVSLLGTANLLAERNYFEPAGFEKTVQPDRSDWHWISSDLKKFDGVKAKASRATDEKHTGEAALLLSDSDMGPQGHSLGYLIAPAHLPAMADGTLHCSAWVRQRNASRAGIVGIGVYIEYLDAAGEKKSLGESRFIQQPGTTDWTPLTIDLKVPANPKLLLFYLHCARGGGNTAEAFFDDVAITLSPAKGKTIPSAALNADSLRKEYSEPFTVTTDGFSRPEIRNGTWFQDGSYRLFVGGTLDARNPQLGDWPPRRGAAPIDHIAYRKPPSKEVFDAIGVNSCQLAMPCSLVQWMLGADLPSSFSREAAMSRSWIAGFQGMPMTACDFTGSIRDLKHDPSKAKALDQRSGIWHEFMPWCPESPGGSDIYQKRTDTLVRQYLKWGVNVSVYELSNEPTYNCQCRYNAARFAQEMAQQYGNIANANRVWGSCFASFDDVKQVTQFENYPKLWPDWCKFSARQYAAFLKLLADRIRAVDRRPNVFFSEQCSLAAIFGNYGAGMDFREAAKILDVLALEGGLKYGDTARQHTNNDLEFIVHSSSREFLFTCDFYQALTEGKKPVTNNEHYCLRSENGKRVPSRRNDLITSFWTEFFHGLSSSYVYMYDKRAWEWKSLEDARNVVEKISYKSSSLLNPYNWPPSELNAFAVFRKEAEPHLDRLAPFPRVKPATVAILYSQATLAMTGIRRLPFKDKLLAWYGAALLSQYPLKVVFEDHLDRTLSPEVKVLLAPAADYLPDSTREALRRFRRRGGQIIADNAAFRFDERENRREAAVDAIRLDAADVHSCAALLKILDRMDLQYGTLRDAAGKPVRDADLQMIDRGDFKMLFLLAPDTEYARLVTLALPKLENGEWFVTDVVRNELYVSPQGESWPAETLRRGIPVILPGQERVLFSLKRTRPDGAAPVTGKRIHARFAEIAAQDHAARSRRAATRQRAFQEAAEARIYRDVPHKRCSFVDLRRFANMGFADEKALDRTGGWFDEGFNNDFGSMTSGVQVLAGVPFDVIDPAQNSGKSCLVLYGVARPYFPEAIPEIPIGKQAKHLYFLHSMGYGVPPDTEIATYRVRYDDGATIDIPVRFPLEIGEWWGDKPIRNGKIAVESINQQGQKTNMQCFRWRNPFPAKTIQSLDVISKKTGGIPALVAITVEANQ